MSRTPAPSFPRFVGAVHRHFILVRAAERLGLALLLASAACGLALPLLWWDSRPALPVIATILALGTLIGLLAAFIRRPTKLAAVIEADRQLRLHDLLSTALTTGSTDDPWPAVIRSLAEAKCRDLSPGRVIYHRWGGRAWGGVSLAVTVVLAAAWMLNQPSTLVAGVDKPADLFRPPAKEFPKADRGPTAAYHPRLNLPAPHSVVSDQGNNTDQGSTALEQTTAPGAAHPSAQPGSASASGGTGSGSAQTTGRPAAPLSQAADAKPDAFTKPSSKAGTAIGQGVADASSDKSPTVAPGVVSGNLPKPAAGWQADPAQAADRDHQWQQRLQAQPQLDAYRDLVQRYFSRE